MDVVIVTGHDRREMVREGLTALGEEFRTRVAAAKQIFIHPNLVSSHRREACTDVEAVRGVLDHISLLRSDRVLIGDAGVRNTKKAFKKLDYLSLERSGNMELVDLNDDETVEAFAYTAAMEKRPIGFSKTVVESDMNIVVVPAKMHSYYIVSLSIKTHIVGAMVVPGSAFGLLHMRWPWLHTGYKLAHHSLADVYEQHPAQLAIIDGTQAMEGNGPASGTTVDLGWLVVSFNAVAADALAACLLGLDPANVGYLYLLNEKGLGPIDPAQMALRGSHPDSLRRKLERPDSYPAMLAWR